jgi:hypothetical protein
MGLIIRYTIMITLTVITGWFIIKFLLRYSGEEEENQKPKEEEEQK